MVVARLVPIGAIGPVEGGVDQIGVAREPLVVRRGRRRLADGPGELDLQQQQLAQELAAPRPIDRGQVVLDPGPMPRVPVGFEPIAGRIDPPGRGRDLVPGLSGSVLAHHDSPPSKSAMRIISSLRPTVRTAQPSRRAISGRV